MMGLSFGVATQIKVIQQNALETHCHAYSLSLAVKKTTTRSKVLRDTLDNVGDICLLISFYQNEKINLNKFRGMMLQK